MRSPRKKVGESLRAPEEVLTLEREYCPPLEPALIYPIYSDFEDEPNALDLARNVLEELKNARIEEELANLTNDTKDTALRASESYPSIVTKASALPIPRFPRPSDPQSLVWDTVDAYRLRQRKLKRFLKRIFGPFDFSISADHSLYRIHVTRS